MTVKELCLLLELELGGQVSCIHQDENASWQPTIRAVMLPDWRGDGCHHAQPEMLGDMDGQLQFSLYLHSGSCSEQRAAGPRQRREKRQGPGDQRVKEQVAKNLS